MDVLARGPLPVESARAGQRLAAAGPSRAGAFFDLDRTLISRPTPLALAATFRQHGLLRTRDLVKASLWQILFALPGIDGARHASVEGMKLLKGVPVATIEKILAEAMESVLRPLLFSGPLDLLARHRQAGQPAYILSASLHEIVQHVADDLGFDGAAGSTCEIIDGVFTGVSLRPLYGEHKAAALHEIAAAAGIDLAESTAYSDSASDLAFLEAVGSPVAVNPDRKLRRIAAQRGWRILRFEQLVTSGAQARTSP